MSWAAVAVGGTTLLGKHLKSSPKAKQVELKGASQQQADQSFGNTQQGLQNQQQFLNALQGQNGIQNQSDVYNQYAGIASGQAPNPALEAQKIALANATGANVANQASLMAGQRGSNANAGLMARQAAMQGANIQQQAAGQGAMMQGELLANQQANALAAMGNISGQQVSNLGNAGNAYANTALGQQQNVLNSLNNQNNAAAGLAGQANEMAMANAKADNQMMGGIANAAGGLLSAGMGALTKPGTGSSTPKGMPTSDDWAKWTGASKAASGGEVKPGQIGNNPKASGPQSSLGRALAMKSGGKVPGQAKVAGDSLKNDTVPALLSPGEIVIPRTVANKGPEAAAKFVAAIQARKKHSKK